MKKTSKPVKRLSIPRRPPERPALSSDFISMEDMYEAYRKAKVDVFYERAQPMSLAFCDYERALHQNLVTLREKLTTSPEEWSQNSTFIGDYGFIPKCLTIPPSDPNQPHFSQSDPDDAWKALLRRCKMHKPSPFEDAINPEVQFRAVANFSVDMYVICALWVNLVGHKFDACLDTCATGTRLRRLREREPIEGHPADYHIQATGSFQPYFQCYREWRQRGLEAIRRELTEERRVVVVTMDLTSFYHNIDPEFMLNPEFWKKARFKTVNNSALTEEEVLFTRQLVDAFKTWSAELPHLDEEGPPGVPVGPSAARIIANVLLTEFDRLIQRNLAPVYYGRYVDDVFLVLPDSGTLTSPEKVVGHLARRISRLNVSDDGQGLKLDLPYAGKSILLFKTEKQHIFLLSGEVGEDLLDTIESKIQEVSSEWRLLPNLDDLERSPAARVLTAAARSSDEADSLRKADQLSIRRLGFALLLRSVDAVARDLPSKEWKTERFRFYRFILRHVLTPLRLLDLHDYLPRLLSLAIACRDWDEAHRIAKRIVQVVEELKSNVVIKPASNSELQWQGFRKHLKQALLEAIVRGYPLKSTQTASAAADRIIEVVNQLAPEIDDLFADTCARRAKDLFSADLSRTPFKDRVIDGEKLPDFGVTFDVANLPPKRSRDAEVIVEFLQMIQLQVDCLIPLLFPTRPLNAPEITECLPSAAENLYLLSKIIHALRGTWVKPGITGEKHVTSEDFVEIGLRRTAVSQNRSDQLSD